MGCQRGKEEAAHSSVVAPWLAGRAPPMEESGAAQGREGEAMVYVLQSDKLLLPSPPLYSTVRGNYLDLPCAGSMDGRRHGGEERTRNVARERRKKARSMLALSLPRPRWRAPSFLSPPPPPRWWWWLVEAEGELLLPPQTLSASAGTLSGAAATLVRWSVGPMSRPLPPCGPDDGRRRRRRVGLSPSPSLAEKETE